MKSDNFREYETFQLQKASKGISKGLLMVTLDPRELGPKAGLIALGENQTDSLLNEDLSILKIDEKKRYM